MFKYFKFKGTETRNYESAADFKEEKTITRGKKRNKREEITKLNMKNSTPVKKITAKGELKTAPET